jgi:hypothetical protein
MEYSYKMLHSQSISNRNLDIFSVYYSYNFYFINNYYMLSKKMNWVLNSII